MDIEEVSGHVVEGLKTTPGGGAVIHCDSEAEAAELCQAVVNGVGSFAPAGTYDAVPDEEHPSAVIVYNAREYAERSVPEQDLRHLSNADQREVLEDAFSIPSDSHEDVLRYLWSRGYVIAAIDGPGI